MRGDKAHEAAASVASVLASVYMDSGATPYQWLVTKSAPGPQILLPQETIDDKHLGNFTSHIHLLQCKDCIWILI